MGSRLPESLSSLLLHERAARVAQRLLFSLTSTIGHDLLQRAQQKAVKASMDEVDPELLATLGELGIPFNRAYALAGVAVDGLLTSVSVCDHL